MGDHNDKIEKIDCPVCKSANYRQYDSFASGLGISVCSECNTAYTSPRLVAEERNKIYQSGYFNGNSIINMDVDYTKDAEIFINDARERANLLHRYLNGNNLRVLEVGSAAGFFLNELKKDCIEVIGVEISTDMCNYCLENFGIKCHNGTLKDAAIEDLSLDAVAMWHVLEHTASPLKELQLINRKLKENGYLFITVPNFDSGNARRRKLEWPHLQPEVHLLHFSPMSLRKLLKQADFEPVKFIKSGGTGLLGRSSSLPNLLRTLLINNIKKITFLRNMIKYIFVNLFGKDDFITVIGRKK